MSTATAPITHARVTTATPPQVRMQKMVVVHSGARDGYQVAIGLAQAGLLDCLITDFFWSEDAGVGRFLAGILPGRVLSVLRQRSAPGLPRNLVRTVPSTALGSFLLDKASRLPFRLRRGLTRKADARLGAVAGRVANRTGAHVLSYSYYAYDAFRIAKRDGMLFQMHPHPETMRQLLQDEIRTNPDCAASLSQEWELNLPPDDFQRLVEETTMPSTSLVASSFTKRSLVEHGVDPHSVHVIPYGIDLVKFHPGKASNRSAVEPLKLLFVGRINQRKGIKYLLQALALLPDAPIELTVCGRVLDGLELFEQEAARTRIRPSISSEELVKAYQHADLFVLPSIGEGFGQVLLEALACGLPILSTTNTAATDLIEEGVQGFVVEPRRPDQLASRLAWALANREALLQMREAARERAEKFPWSRFHQGIVQHVQTFLSKTSLQEEVA